MKDHRQHIKFGISTEKRQPVEKKMAGVTAPHVWTELTLDQLPRDFVIIDQDGSSSCGSQGPKKLINFQTGGSLIVSAHPFYRARSNYPDEGMSLEDILSIPCESGTTLESIDPSNGLNEEQMDLPVTVSTPIKCSSPEELNVDDIEELASACDAYGGVVLTVNIAWSEWDTEQGVPSYIPGATVDGGHCMAGKIPAIYNSKKGIFAQNSWGNDDDSINSTSWVFFTEDFLKARGTGAGTFKQPIMNNDLFAEDLREGSTGPDVVKLQNILSIKADGDFGAHTLEAVIAFQVEHGLEPDGVVGPLTMAELANMHSDPTPEPAPQPKQYQKLLGWCISAQAYEGWTIDPPSRSYENNNPGNLEFADQPGAVLESGHEPNRFAHFDTYTDGFQALYDLFLRACTGMSTIYRPDMTLLDFYNVYAPGSDGNNSNDYASYIANALGVEESTQISTFVL